MYRINGVSDHLHIITHLHPTISLAALVKDIKLATTEYIENEFLFPSFNGWQDGYGAFTVSKSQLSEVEDYIRKQREHHRFKTFQEEYRAFLDKHGITYDERYLWD